MDNEFVLGINITPLLKAYQTFDTYRLHIIDEQDHAGARGRPMRLNFLLSWCGKQLNVFLKKRVYK